MGASQHPPARRQLDRSGSPLVLALPDADRERLAPFFEIVELEPGAVVVREGATDRALYVVLEGTARIGRRGLFLGEARRGGHFGELALVAGRPRAATVTARTRLVLAVLTRERYGDLAGEFPALALSLITTLVGGIAERLLEVTDSVGLLLEERALPRRASVEVGLQDGVRTVRTGTPYSLLLPERIGDVPVVAALVDHKLLALSAPVSCDCNVTALLADHWEGERIYRQSEGLALLEAARRTDPALVLALGHSVGFAQRVSVSGYGDGPMDGLATRLEEQLQTLVADAAPLREEWWTVDEARAHFAAQGGATLAALLDTWREPAVPLVAYGEAYALRFGPMLPSTARLAPGVRVLPDDGGLLMVYGGLATALPEVPATLVARAREASQQAVAMTEDQEKWLQTLGITSVGAFNRACVRGDVSQLIRVSEGFQEKRIGRIADELAARPDVRVVCISGPSSSGKTTFIKRLSVQLQVNGTRPVGLSLDDYYVDRDKNPRDARGDYDFEAFEALRIELFQEHLERLLRGESVRTAHYHFPTGTSDPEGGPLLTLGSSDVLLLEGIHGLNPRLFAALPPGSVFRVFVCPLAQLPFDQLTRVHASDVRLLRRIVRDRHGRGSMPASNILRWPSVRAGERKHIFPYQHHADAVFDSSLIYELSVLKVFAERYLLEVPQDDPAYATAFRLLGLLDRFVTIYPDHVPPTSILREFIGGSGFEY